MNYSDEELKIATDLAYMDLHKAYEKLNSDINVVQAIEYLIKNHNEDLSDNEVNHYREIIDKIEAIEKEIMSNGKLLITRMIIKRIKLVFTELFSIRVMDILLLFGEVKAC